MRQNIIKRIAYSIVLFFGLTTVTVYAANKEAIFAGGCFWCMQSDFDKLPGVVKTTAGYDGGKQLNPTYQKVSSGRTNYVESVKVVYDDSRLSYSALLDYFWQHIDPTTEDAEFCDHGRQYRSVVFYLNSQQKQVALKSLAEIKTLFPHVYTSIIPSTTFYPAETYHQDYYKKNPDLYHYYRLRCGRDARVKAVWQGKTLKDNEAAYTHLHFNKAARLKALTPLQYTVTQENGTERAFDNQYWDNKKPGIYVDVVSGEVLFSSTDKYQSGSGWPSFDKALDPDNIVKKSDHSLLEERTEVRSKHADSHLGHVFQDPRSPTGIRYCMNSAALRFIPADKLDQEGYGRYDYLFKKDEKHSKGPKSS